eukprot:scaffold2699_cov376-Prasinococcus_capsulatus_cf.AAC.1
MRCAAQGARAPAPTSAKAPPRRPGAGGKGAAEPMPKEGPTHRPSGAARGRSAGAHVCSAEVRSRAQEVGQTLTAGGQGAMSSRKAAREPPPPRRRRP